MRAIIPLGIAFLLGAFAHELGWLPHAAGTGIEEGRAEANLDLLDAATSAQAEPETSIARIWDAPNRGYAQVELRNEGDAVLGPHQATIRCAAFDGEDRVLGINARSNPRALKVGEKTDLVIELALEGARSFESIQCGLETPMHS